MVASQKKWMLIFIFAVLLTFSRSQMLSAQKGSGVNDGGSTEVIGDQGGDDDFDVESDEETTEKIIVNKVKPKVKKHRPTKEKLTNDQKKQKLIERELRRFENANKSIDSREKKAKKILKEAQEDRANELIKHDKKIEEIKSMEMD